MEDHGGVRAALRELGRSVRDTLPPPGDLAVVHARARRRRLARTSVLAAGLAVIAAAAVVAPTLRTQPPPAQHALATGSPGPATVGSPVAEPTTDPAADPATPTAGPTSPAAGPGPGPGPQTDPGSAAKDRCLTRLRWTTVVDNWVTVTYSPDEQCAQVTVRFFWASYTIRADGSAVLYASQQYHLNATTPSVHAHLEVPNNTCTWFVVIGEQPVKFVISASLLAQRPPAEPGPYPNPNGGPPASVMWQLPGVCAAVSTTTNPPPTTP